jgi:hypothetical protein
VQRVARERAGDLPNGEQKEDPARACWRHVVVPQRLVEEADPVLRHGGDAGFVINQLAQKPEKLLLGQLLEPTVNDAAAAAARDLAPQEVRRPPRAMVRLGSSQDVRHRSAALVVAAKDFDVRVNIDGIRIHGISRLFGISD